MWNPASGSIEQIMATAAEIDAHATVTAAARSRSCNGSSPSLRSSSQGLEPMTVDQMADAVRAARDAGIAHVVVDTGFTTQVADPDDWVTFPDRLAPLLDAASGADQPG